MDQGSGQIAVEKGHDGLALPRYLVVVDSAKLRVWLPETCCMGWQYTEEERFLYLLFAKVARFKLEVCT